MLITAVSVRSAWYEFIACCYWKEPGYFSLEFPDRWFLHLGDAMVWSRLHHQGYTHALSCRSLPRGVGAPLAGTVQARTLSIHEHKHTFGFG